VTGERVQFLSGGGGRNEDVSDIPSEYSSSSGESMGMGQSIPAGGRSGGNSLREPQQSSEGSISVPESPPFPLSNVKSQREASSTANVNSEETIDDIPF
jgi:hypothetical protein